MAEGPHNFIYNYGAPDFRLPYRTNDDTPLSLPLAPKNVMVTSPYMIGVLDVRWDDPSIYAENNGLDFEGVNVYRAYDGPDATYEKLNSTPVGVMFYRDQTREVEVVDEDPVAGGRFIAGTNATGDWIVKTYHQPIIIPGTNGKVADSVNSVIVRIKETSASDWQVVPAFRVMGETGEIFLIKNKVYNHTTNRLDDPVLPDLARGGEIRVTYTYINNWIQTDINRKIYYRVTSVAVDPDSGESRETPIDETVAVNPYDMERIDWIWAESIRRNRFILEQGGERVKLFIRRWAGTRCSCWDQEYRTGRASCLTCFPEGEEVALDDGSKKRIENMVVGDQVLTMDGEAAGVLQTMSREYSGDLVTIKALGNEEFSCTEDHPVLIIPKEECFCVRYKKTYSKNRCVPGKKRRCHESTPCEKVMTPKWVEASKVKEGDYLLTPIVVSSGAYLSKGKMFLVGLYAADGSVSWNGSHTKFNRVRFSLGANESTLIEYTKKVFFEEYGLELRSTVTKGREGVVELYAHCDEAAEDFKVACPGVSTDKKFNIGVMHAPEDEVVFLIAGYVQGDGCRSARNGIQYSTASKDLAYQMQLLFAKVGCCCAVSEHVQQGTWGKGNNVYVGLVPSSDVSGLHFPITKMNNKKVSKRQHRILNFGNYIGHPVVRVSSKSFKGLVYNIDVDRNHTYLVGNSVVHNCYGTGYVGGYYGPYDWIVAPPETEKIVELQDVGLHVNYDWASWGGPYPLVNDRDFIVRQNNDRYSIAHVNPQGARGAIFQQHFNLAPLDHNDVRYKVPITGGEDGVPPAWNAYRTDRPTDASPTIPDKPEIPDQYQLKGRTVTFENIVYAIPFLVVFDIAGYLFEAAGLLPGILS